MKRTYRKFSPRAKYFSKLLYLFTFMVILMVALTACKPPVTPPPATPVPTATQVPDPILYLVMREDERTVVYTDYKSYIPLDAMMRSGDAVPVKDKINWEGFMWYEVLCGHLQQFPVGSTGWVKFRAEKMILEWRQP